MRSKINPTKSVHITQVYFNDKSSRGLEPEFTHYFNPNEPRPFFENTILVDLYKNPPDVDYIGLTSWKYRVKTYDQIPPAKLIELVSRGEFDCYLYLPMLYPAYRLDNFWLRNRFNKTVIHEVAQIIKPVLPVDPELSFWEFNYCNFWVMKMEAFKEYVEDWLLPAMEALAPLGHVMNYRGKKYPVHPFICEALVGSFLGLKKYSYIQAFKLFWNGKTEINGLD